MSNTNSFKPFDLIDLNDNTFKRFLKHCSDQGASDITIQGGDFVWAEKHGRLLQASTTKMQQQNLDTLITTIWGGDVIPTIKSGMGVDRTLELSNRDGIDIDRGDFIRFRTNLVQARVGRTSDAISITMRIIPSELPDIDKMNIEKELFENLFPQMGLILVCGPTGSGKTTLQTAIYCHIGKNYPNRKTITYEDPIEFILGGKHWIGLQPSQSQIGKDVKSFAEGLKIAMRRKPSIIGIGEARDLETIDAMIESALSGHLTYATCHTESVADTINRIIQVYPPAQQSAIANRLIGTLRTIVVQRLLKTTDGKRVAIREFLIFDKEIKRNLRETPNENWSAIIDNKINQKKGSLIDKAWALYQKNRIDENEFVELAGIVEFKKRCVK